MPSLPPPHRPAQALLINNTANWQAGSKAAHDVVSRGELGKLRHVSCILASPLGWLFEGKEHANWTKVEGTMRGNGFGWGQFSHTFAWVYKVTGLTPKTVYAVVGTSGAAPRRRPFSLVFCLLFCIFVMMPNN